MRCHLVGKWSHIGPSLPTGVWGRVLHCWLAKRFPAVMTRRDASFVFHTRTHIRSHTYTHTCSCASVLLLGLKAFFWYYPFPELRHIQGGDTQTRTHTHTNTHIYTHTHMLRSQSGLSVCKWINLRNERKAERWRYISESSTVFSSAAAVTKQLENRDNFIGFDACLPLPRAVKMAIHFEINIYPVVSVFRKQNWCSRTPSHLSLLAPVCITWPFYVAFPFPIPFFFFYKEKSKRTNTRHFKAHENILSAYMVRCFCHWGKKINKLWYTMAWNTAWFCDSGENLMMVNPCGLVVTVVVVCSTACIYHFRQIILFEK